MAGIVKENRDLLDYLEALGFSQEFDLARTNGKTQSPANGQVPANPKAQASSRLVFVGDEPNTGASAELLKKMIGAMAIGPVDSIPILFLNDELEAQLMAHSPDVIVALGSKAAQFLLSSSDSITDLRGRFVSHSKIKAAAGGASEVLATFEPSLLLQNPGFKKLAWEDLQLVMKRL